MRKFIVFFMLLVSLFVVDANATDYYYTTGTHVNIRQAPTIDSEVVGRFVKKGSLFIGVKENDDWIGVVTPPNRVDEYVSSKFVKKASTSNIPASFLSANGVNLIFLNGKVFTAFIRKINVSGR